MKIYTAGMMDSVINNKSNEDLSWKMLDWRNKVTDYFTYREDIEILNPTRRSHNDDLNDKEIFNLDINDIDNSDLIIADCRLHEGLTQFGTPCEIFYFNHILKRPVLGWYNAEEGYRERSVFQNVLVDRLFPSLDRLLDHVSAYYQLNN